MELEDIGTTQVDLWPSSCRYRFGVIRCIVSNSAWWNINATLQVPYLPLLSSRGTRSMDLLFLINTPSVSCITFTPRQRSKTSWNLTLKAAYIVFSSLEMWVGSHPDMLKSAKKAFICVPRTTPSAWLTVVCVTPLISQDFFQRGLDDGFSTSVL